ncbi:hypothetical protein [Polyangium aurulentum]|uniref:hypothetical protein n=1 Tax=Polyangium aurulentum TaxID=2567896 RepID=UPI0010ADFD14|nr:hypothetical protein [Polyangium aurulentum]UQA55218.1 hypothetical protein E8A73_028180 [Polyangium aurulentum]
MTNPSTGRVLSQVGSLDELVGAHPDALRRIYGSGRVADPAELGESPRGRLLAIEAGQDAFLAVRRVIQLLATDRSPWQGKAFEPSDGTGHNVVLGRRSFPFAVELGDSAVDGLPTLVLRYDEPRHKNPWPVRALRDELRAVSDGVAIGPVLHQQRVVGWFGLSRR